MLVIDNTYRSYQKDTMKIYVAIKYSSNDSVVQNFVDQFYFDQ